ncbi:MAG: nicotinate-nucleotide--dimethylbenzimidazole phosphoribosyltransferase [Burkholderiales bacterium]|nr:nicotinate-nucleotide--dimethylbenzimidazole phosphoribosyltransferase [Burkholderiales bacterium]MDE1927769.1 nicotinate-nucleotide--dimethylbenzimidazole phosphoribosyltransferase [Burkholderiales bacterium]MDE2504033.1 nicotinate-nucleotide--dimethylbenzimidazole phosphoribosyltransferase [Burkholderiales bacterium]
MPAPTRSLVQPTSHPLLEKALHEKLQRRNEAGGSLGELEPLAIRLGLMQNTLKPRFRHPHLLVFAGDHGLAVEGLRDPHGRATHETVRMLLTNQLPLTVFARAQQLELSVVDCGMAENLAPHERLLTRKIAHATRNARVTAAMSREQAHAGMRAGMEIGDKLKGNLTIMAGVGVGANESAAMVLARLTETNVRDLIVSGPEMDSDELAHLMVVLHGAQSRHREATEPFDVLAALGGFEIAVMVGVMLMAASKRHLLMIDGIPACAALMVASRIAQPVTDYCVFCRSHSHLGLDQALNLFRASALLELGMESTDGTGATLAWPLVKSAAALLTEVAEGEDAGPSRPAEMGDAPHEPFIEEPPEAPPFADPPLY